MAERRGRAAVPLVTWPGRTTLPNQKVPALHDITCKSQLVLRIMTPCRLVWILFRSITPIPFLECPEEWTVHWIFNSKRWFSLAGNCYDVSKDIFLYIVIDVKYDAYKRKGKRSAFWVQNKCTGWQNWRTGPVERVKEIRNSRKMAGGKF